MDDNNIKCDSIENSIEYQQIQNELEIKLNSIPEISKHKGSHGYCHIYWNYKKSILNRDYNIDWKSPEELNPEIIFD